MFLLPKPRTPIVGGSLVAQDSGDGVFVVAVGRDRMGAGSDEFGKILIKGYIYTLREMQFPPK